MVNATFWIKGVSIWIDTRYYDWIVIRIKRAIFLLLHNILIVNNNALCTIKMNNLILKLGHSSEFQISKEGLKIQKIVSSISPLDFIKLLFYADNKVNPRTATVNTITKSIYETLDTSPELFWFKSKGILLSTESCELLDRNRVRLSFDNIDYEGIMDGGHNSFAIARFIIDKLYTKTLKTWDECKDFWKNNFEDILSKFADRSAEFKFSIPIEIITPNNENGAINEFYDYISEICSARNNNVQLKETAKGNQVGYYDYLKGVLSEHDIIWKTGSTGSIKSEDVISLATLPLIFLKEQNLLPNDIRCLSKISIYSQKSKCVEFFNEIMGHKDISTVENGKYILKINSVKTALNLVDDIIKLFDKFYICFPNLYHQAAPGKFGRITSVNNKKRSKAPFSTTTENCDYQYPYGFFYPLLCGITNIMAYDNAMDEVYWKIDPKRLDLNKLDLSQYVELIKATQYDPNKVGKAKMCYNEAENIFLKLKEN